MKESVITAQKKFISFEEYNAVDALRSSFLRNLASRSPAHAQLWAASSEGSAAMDLGTALHCAVLEPAKFAKQFVAMPKIDRRTKEGKAEEARMQAEFSHATFLSADDMQRVRGMHAALLAHPIAQDLFFTAGESEVSIFWTRSGIPCKARIDRLTRTKQFYAACDLKTTEDASPEGFARSVIKYGYHTQNAWYDEALSAIGERIDTFVFVAVESKPPHAVCCYVLDYGLLEVAKTEIDKAFRIYRECRKSNNWPAYPTDLQTIFCPAWLVDVAE